MRRKKIAQIIRWHGSPIQWLTAHFSALLSLIFQPGTMIHKNFFSLDPHLLVSSPLQTGLHFTASSCRI